MEKKHHVLETGVRDVKIRNNLRLKWFQAQRIVEIPV